MSKFSAGDPVAVVVTSRGASTVAKRKVIGVRRWIVDLDDGSEFTVCQGEWMPRDGRRYGFESYRVEPWDDATHGPVLAAQERRLLAARVIIALRDAAPEELAFAEPAMAALCIALQGAPQ